MTATAPTVAIFGASGLIGQAVARHLVRAGIPVVPVARRFTAGQRQDLGPAAVEVPILDLDPARLRSLLDAHRVDIVVNCVGVLQGGRHGGTAAAHQGFVGRLLAALAGRAAPSLLVHLSIPGHPEADTTRFSQSKRAADRLIAEAAVPFAILRPGFVIAPAAYGGSALLRALAALPFGLPAREAGSPFATTAVADIGETVARLARRWRAGERDWRVVWDVMERQPADVGQVVEAFRRWIGGPAPRFRLPSWLMRLGALAGDAAAPLGWRPPIRSTALWEMRRGVTGDPAPWAAALGLEPTSCAAALAGLAPGVQERWFGRLYLLKPLVVGGLAAFWIVSGLVSLIPGFAAASAILTAHGFPEAAARAATVVTSLADIAVGLAVAVRSTCRRGLLAGIALTLAYMGAAGLVAPELWLDPLGPLIKPWPVMILMLVALAILDDR
ncbi:SDR family oxidoreductase [Methylobacterium sp. NMS14P]|uniref:SDR family oxidoreductase n=1 Tax=Methylobacterium sp. NMS14P TaxID=2894310 RepID=UPI0023599C9C|nr:SDR family oxidoreductase [Methylobacterium sp. NMS14P]WCS23353.1 SDR family oxidoreductase [Methylobacterium sp. NMS14P]